MSRQKEILQMAMFGLAPIRVCRDCGCVVDKCTCRQPSTAPTKKGKTIDLPQAGQIFERDGKQRLVVSIRRGAMEFPHDFDIEWRRPGNDWRSWTMWLPNWDRWVKKATLIEKPAKMKIHMASGDKTIPGPFDTDRIPLQISICGRSFDQGTQGTFITEKSDAVTCKQCLARIKK